MTKKGEYVRVIVPPTPPAEIAQRAIDLLDTPMMYWQGAGEQWKRKVREIRGEWRELAASIVPPTPPITPPPPKPPVDALGPIPTWDEV